MRDREWTVLLIGGDEAGARTVRRALEDRGEDGWRLEHAERLQEGLDRLARADAVLVDDSLLDGRTGDPFRAISAGAADAPILVLTARESKEATWRAVRGRVHGCLVKEDLLDGVLLCTLTGAIGWIRAEKERRELRSRLARVHRLEAIGQLAAGIAHEINTPIQFVGDNTRFVQDSLGDLIDLLREYGKLLEADKKRGVHSELVADIELASAKADLEYLVEELPKAVRQSLEGIDRVTRIVRAMKEFSHPGDEEKGAVDLNRAIENTITVARSEWKDVADVVTDFDPSLPPVTCLRGDLSQAVLNILVNAAHAVAEAAASRGGGRGLIHVSTRRQGESAEIRIRDIGPGIPEAVRPRIFDPFFTTKGVGRGTGQGLAIAWSTVVEKHGGTLTFETEMGRGTTFVIRVPISPGTSDKGPSEGTS